MKMKNQKQSLFTTILIINNKPKILNCFRCISKCLLYFYIFHACILRKKIQWQAPIDTDATSNVLKFFVDANWHKEVSRMWLRKKYLAFLNFSMDNILRDCNILHIKAEPYMLLAGVLNFILGQREFNRNVLTA
ncbi:hypothetical protein ACJX0J_026884 [Zea mays]